MTFRSLGKHIYLAIEKAASDQVQRRHCVNIRETLEVVIMMNKEELYTLLKENGAKVPELTDDDLGQVFGGRH